jgi:hypothetical protein
VLLFESGISDLSGLRALEHAGILHIARADQLQNLRDLSALDDVRVVDSKTTRP